MVRIDPSLKKSWIAIMSEMMRIFINLLREICIFLEGINFINEIDSIFIRFCLDILYYIAIFKIPRIFYLLKERELEIERCRDVIGTI